MGNTTGETATMLAGRIAIVTGAGGGLGRSHALMLARLGANLVVNDVNLDAATAVVEEIEAVGGTAVAFAASVTDEARIAEMAAFAKERWGRIDILINNAGILRDKTFAKMTIAEFRDVVDVHLMGSVICTKAVWEMMREQRFGRIVMTTSSSGLFGNFGQSNYGAAKMALVGLMQTLALEGEKYSIHVNCLAPTAATSMTDSLFTPEALEQLSPDFVSPGLLALVAENAPTRAILCAGGGHFARSNLTLTQGVHVGVGDSVAEGVIHNWDRISDRSGEIIPDYGFTQMEREIASQPFAVKAKLASG